jgi:hypothetical protein
MSLRRPPWPIEEIEERNAPFVPTPALATLLIQVAVVKVPGTKEPPAPDALDKA